MFRQSGGGVGVGGCCFFFKHQIIEKYMLCMNTRSACFPLNRERVSYSRCTKFVELSAADDPHLSIASLKPRSSAAVHMQPVTSQASAGYSGRDAPLGDARTKWQKEARNQDVSNHPTLQVLTHAHTHALTPSFSGGPRSVQEHRR